MWRAFSWVKPAPRLPMTMPPYQNGRVVQREDKQFVLRLAQRDDIPAMVDIERSVYDGQAPWREQDFLSEIVRFGRRLYVVLAYEGQPIGFVGSAYWREKSDLHITNIAVLPIWQNQGFGAELIQEIETTARQMGLATLSLEVRRSNTAAQRLYERLGFRVTSVKPRYYHGDHEDALEMHKELTDASSS